MDKDVSLVEKIREQRIKITSVLTAIGMAIDVLVEALLAGGGGTGSASAVEGKPPPKDEKVNKPGTNLKPWLGY